ncbi:MAG: thioredoxin domain-containing protein [Steroidobacteraceae bacterium]
MSNQTSGNRLTSETSPYLRQHADNPVHWQPWDDAALEIARASGKPILLSIGYAACHWCHVMAHESFEDPATAAVMNELFVNIKVDREERPDLDRIYQLAHQLLTRRGGGWPLTMFLAHDDQRPFFGGTYFPPQARFGLPAFRDLLERVAAYYRERQSELREQNRALLSALTEIMAAEAGEQGPLDAEPIKAWRSEIAAQFDARHGGFGGAPKFPHVSSIDLLLRQWWRSARSEQPDLEALAMHSLTLQRMADGGLFDHLGGGFCRYSVDASWQIPHFEKMLYDNAGLIASYAEAALATGEERYRKTANEVGDWLLREMQAPGGAFYSSLDADSEGEEGRFYVWQRDEIAQQLTAPDQDLFAARFGLDGEPNFESAWHLAVKCDFEALAAQANLPVADVRARIDSARARLLAVRDERVRPSRDEKILTSWNALAIRGLVIAARSLRRDDLADAARSASAFLLRHLYRDARLLATALDDGTAKLNGYLDDYALLADALVELLQLGWQPELGAALLQLIETLLAQFADEQAGGFFFTSRDHESLLLRSRSFADDASIGGSACATRVLQRCGWLFAEPRYLAAAEKSLRAARAASLRHPAAHSGMLLALDEFLHPPALVILRGPRTALAEWCNELDALYDAGRLVFPIAEDCAGLPAALAGKAGVPGEVRAYVCRGLTCGAALASLEDLVAALGYGGAAAACG